MSEYIKTKHLQQHNNNITIITYLTDNIFRSWELWIWVPGLPGLWPGIRDQEGAGEERAPAWSGHPQGGAPHNCHQQHQQQQRREVDLHLFLIFFVCWRINYLFKYLSLIKYSLNDKALTWYMLHVKRLTRYDKVQMLFL